MNSYRDLPNPYLPNAYKIIEIIPQTDIDYTYRIACDIKPLNGQFVEVSIPGVGEAPISISDFGDGYIDLTLRHVGKVTNYIKALKKQDVLFIRGPYGNGFPINEYKGKHLIIAAGGTGLAPVKSIINYFHVNPHEIERLDILAGFKTPKDVLFRDELDSWSENEKLNVTLTVDIADECWPCKTGLITKHVSSICIPCMEKVQVIVVGPPVMMKYTVQEFINYKVPEDNIWVSFERKMSCGIGKCGHCKIDEVYVCLEGPVFNYSKAKKLLD